MRKQLLEKMIHTLRKNKKMELERDRNWHLISIIVNFLGILHPK